MLDTAKGYTDIGPGQDMQLKAVAKQRFYNTSPLTFQTMLNDDGGLFAVGVVTSILIPIVGFVIGIVLMTKRGWVGAGVICLVLSIIAVGVWFNAMTPDPTYSTYSDY